MDFLIAAAVSIPLGVGMEALKKKLKDRAK